MKNIITYILLIFGSFGTVNCFAQYDSLILKDEIIRLTNSWKEYQTEILRPTQAKGYEEVDKIFKLRNSLLNSYQLDNQVKNAEANLLHGDPALEASASYIENFTPSFNDDDDNLIYQRRLMAGITWQILGDGFVANRYDEKELRNKIKINNYLAPGEMKESSYSINWNLLIYLFNKEKIKILDTRKALVDELIEEAERLHLSKYLTRESYLKILSRGAEVEALQRIYSDYNEQYGSYNDTLGIDAMSLPLLDVNYVEVFKILDPAVKDTLTKLYLENLQLDHSLIHDIRLNTGLRYNFYDLVIPGNRSFFSFVLGVSVPIPFQVKKKNEIARLKADQSMFVLQQQFDGRSKEMLNECYEYRYKLKQYVGFHQKFLLYEELVRRMNATLRMDLESFNPVEGLTLLDDMLAVKMEMIDIRQSLYLKLLRIYTKSGASKPEEMSQVFDMPNYFDMHEVTNQSVYVWSSAFKKKSNDFIAEYIIFNKFNNVVISLNSDLDYQKEIKSLVTKLQPKEVTFEAMIGDNTFINGNITQKLNNLFSAVKTSDFNALHLDVEPHTFADWETNKENYLQKYISMLNEAKTFCTANNLKLAVSIPLHFPEETVKQIISICDKVYFMAYENIKPDYIQRKLLPYKEFNSKLVLAIRHKDFSGRIAMEKYMVDNYQKLEFSNFALHDLSGLIEMDEKNINK